MICDDSGQKAEQPNLLVEAKDVRQPDRCFEVFRRVEVVFSNILNEKHDDVYRELLNLLAYCLMMICPQATCLAAEARF